MPALALAQVRTAQAATPICAGMTAPVYQTVNPASEASLLTRWQSEATRSAVKYGFADSYGMPFRAAASTGARLLPVHRLYKGASNEFLWTIWPNEVTSTAKVGFVDQGVDFYAADHRTDPCETAVQRLVRGSHFRNAVKGSVQYNRLTAAGWSDNQVAFYAAPSSVVAASFTNSLNGMNISLDGSASIAEGATMATYTWDFGDGTSGTGKTVSHTYSNVGPFTVTLTTTDNYGSRDTTSSSVNAIAPNAAPTSAFSNSVQNLSLTVDGSTSKDTDGTISSYAWKFGDGATATGKAALHTYDKSGNYAVVLTVTDNAGSIATSTQSVAVKAAAAGVSAGSLPVGNAMYTLPVGAVYVSPAGSDSAGSGSVSAPFATIKRANSVVAAGDTIVVRAGSYNESIFIGKNDVTVQNYPGEAVWMDGSVVVNGWTQTGSTWTHAGWTPQFDSSASFSTGSNAGGFINASSPMAAHPDQVFFDATQLVQVASAPGPGQFAVDYSAHSISVGSDPNGHTVRASNLAKAIVIAGHNDTIRGIGVRKYATSLPDMGTVFLGGSTGGETIENVVIQDSAAQGLSVGSPSDTINHVSSNANGMTGLHANHAPGLLIQNSEFAKNNTQGFNTQPAASGIKVSRLDGVTIRNNSIHDNNNTFGIWTDENVTHAVIVGNNVYNNGFGIGGAAVGIQNELSDTSIVASNTVVGSRWGIVEYDSGNGKVFNNNLAGNLDFDIGILQDNRYQPGKSTAGVNPTAACPWVSHNEIIANNLFASSAKYFQVYALDHQTNIPADNMSLTIDGNLFSASKPVIVGWGNGDNFSTQQYATPAALQAAKNFGWNNGQASTAGTTLAQQQLTAASATNAVPLPADVAAALGQATGSKHIGTF